MGEVVTPIFCISYFIFNILNFKKININSVWCRKEKYKISFCQKLRAFFYHKQLSCWVFLRQFLFKLNYQSIFLVNHLKRYFEWDEAKKGRARTKNLYLLVVWSPPVLLVHGPAWCLLSAEKSALLIYLVCEESVWLGVLDVLALGCKNHSPHQALHYQSQHLSRPSSKCLEKWFYANAMITKLAMQLI